MSKKKVGIWGLGDCFDYVSGQLREDCELTCLIDNDPVKIGQSMNGIIVEPPTGEIYVKCDYILVSVINYLSILEFCKSAGYPLDKTIFYWQEADDKYKLILLEDRFKNIWFERKKYMARLDSAPYEWGIKKVPNILEATELLEKIKETHCSLCRFGDGEYEIIFGRNRPRFQTVDKKLSIRLREIATYTDDRILIAHAQNYLGLDKLTDAAADGIRAYIQGSRRDEIIQLLGNQVYYDAYVSRPYLIYMDDTNADRVFPLWKKVWEGRNIIMIEGEKGRTGVGNDLFASAQNVRRIVCPSKNAWSSYESILGNVKEIAKSDDLICISLGPTATVLAFDLACMGYQALDIGQIDNEYDWYKMGAKTRMNIPGKYSAEIDEEIQTDKLMDFCYNEQVVSQIK